MMPILPPPHQEQLRTTPSPEKLSVQRSKEHTSRAGVDNLVRSNECPEGGSMLIMNVAFESLLVLEH